MEFSYLKSIGIKDTLIKTIKDLIKNKKVEDGEDLFVIEGLWAYEKIMKGSIKIRAFAFCPEYIKNFSMVQMVNFIIDEAQESYLISSSLCEKLSSRDRAEGFYLLCSFSKHSLDDIKLKDNNLVVVLDGLEKPGNIGTIVRSIDAAGGDGVIICNSSLRKTNQKLIKSSMGSSFIVPVIEKGIEDTISWLKDNGFKIIVTDLRADKSYYDINYKGRIAIIAGNEIRGISDYWANHQWEKVIIPMFGGADSLNVGVAASLVIYEASCNQRDIVRGAFV